MPRFKRKKNRTNNLFGPVLGDPWVTLFEPPVQGQHPFYNQDELAIIFRPWGDYVWKIEWNDHKVSSGRGHLELRPRQLVSGETIWQTCYINYGATGWRYYGDKWLAEKTQRWLYAVDLYRYAQEIGLPMLVVGPKHSRRWRFNPEQAFTVDFTKLGFRVPQTHFKTYDNCLVALYNIPETAVIGRK